MEFHTWCVARVGIHLEVKWSEQKMHIVKLKPFLFQPLEPNYIMYEQIEFIFEHAFSSAFLMEMENPWLVLVGGGKEGSRG